MNKKGKTIELIFLIISLLLIGLFIAMIFREFSYDSCRILESDDLKYINGKVKEYDFGRGAIYITFSKQDNITFTADTMSVIDREGFEKSANEGKIFKIGFTSDTKHRDYRQIALLESEEEVFVSLKSHKKAVIKNYILGFIGILFFGISALYLFFLTIKLIFLRK